MILNIQFPILLDGGLSNELERQGCDIRNDLWTARLLLSNPNAIIHTHLAYLKAGARIISTASYQATISGFMKIGKTASEARDLLIRSVDLAIEARNIYMDGHLGDLPLIAASLGPYGAYLANGSEYNGNYSISDMELFQFHFEKIHILADSNADLLAIETIPSHRECRIIAEILKDIEKPSWVSFSCKNDGKISDGTDLSEAATLLNNHPSVFAVGVNCTMPKYISNLIRIIKIHAPDKRVIVYPNSGESYDSKNKSWAGPLFRSFTEKQISEWLDLGVDIIGGCCRVGPENIRDIGNVLSARSGTK